MRRRAWLLTAAVGIGGCLLRTRDSPRFFRPGSAALEASAEENAEPPAAKAFALRLRGVRSEPFLRERIVWRVSAVQYGLYEERRWIDLPAHFVERALRARLRATPGLRLTDDPRVPVLRIDVLAFDDVLAPTHAADVVLSVTLRDLEHGYVLARTFDARVEIADSDPAAMAQAMGQALDDAVAQVADAVRQSVQGHAPRARANSPR